MMKAKAGGCNALISHFERTLKDEKVHIDQSRTRLNYNLIQRAQSARELIAQAGQLHEETTGRKVRGDAVRMVSWVVTQPANVPQQDSRKFFEACVDFCKTRYGSDNIVGAWVHMDETTPHVHIALTPVLDGKLNAKAMLNRQDLKSFHQDLQRACGEELGYEPAVLLDDSEKERKVLSQLSQTEYIAADNKLREIKAQQAAESERLERLRQEREAAESRVNELRGQLATRANEVDRMREMAIGIDKLQRQSRVLGAAAVAWYFHQAGDVICRALRRYSEHCRGAIESVSCKLGEVNQRGAARLDQIQREARAVDGRIEELEERLYKRAQAKLEHQRSSERKRGSQSLNSRDSGYLCR